MKKNRKIVAYASLTLFFALACVYALAGSYWQAKLSGETDLFTFLRRGGYSVALVEGSNGGSEMIEVGISKKKLNGYTGLVYVGSDVAIICQMSVLLDCVNGRIVSKRVTWDGCT